MEPTESLQRDICSLIRLGMWPREAALAKGVRPDVFVEWMARGKRGEDPACVEFVFAIDQAEAEAEALLLGEVKQGRNGWQQAAWRLERRFPDRWTRRSVNEDERRATAERPPRPSSDDPFETLDNVTPITRGGAS
jgi:hypothetical protein